MSEPILYERHDNGVATITLNRPDRRNAQNKALLDALDSAWTAAANDEDVKVIVLLANGKHFSAGHDLSPSEAVGPSLDYPGQGMKRLYRYEQEKYLGYSRKWRDIPKPSIAAVQGACISGGLMLCWPCDIIIAAENAFFSDPVVMMGVGGVEYHGHTWEFGARKAKEMLFTGEAIDAHEAQRLGMVNRVVPLDDLRNDALALATKIAERDSFALMLAKRAVNSTLDAMGQQQALQTCFDIHELGHAHALALTGKPVLVGLDALKGANARP